MADNVVVTNKTDGTTSTVPDTTTFALDEVVDGTLGTVKVQYVKLMDGTLDGTTKAAVGANGLKVDASGVSLTVGSHAVTNAGTFAVQASEADGANVTLGAKADAKSTATDTTAVSVMSVLKQISASVQAPPSQAVTNAGTFAVQNTPATVSTATLSNVASSATNVTILASNASRKQATVYNDSTQILYLKFGATASSTSHTIQMAAGSYYELPQPVYTGIIDGIWASANGSARVTELT